MLEHRGSYHFRLRVAPLVSSETYLPEKADGRSPTLRSKTVWLTGAVSVADKLPKNYLMFMERSKGHVVFGTTRHLQEWLIVCFPNVTSVLDNYQHTKAKTAGVTWSEGFLG